MQYMSIFLYTTKVADLQCKNSDVRFIGCITVGYVGQFLGLFASFIREQPPERPIPNRVKTNYFFRHFKDYFFSENGNLILLHSRFLKIDFGTYYYYYFFIRIRTNKLNIKNMYTHKIFL